MSEKVCTAKHTKYQPTEEEFRCPVCKKGPRDDGLVVDEPAEGGMECDLLHEEDYLCCYREDCRFEGTSGKRFAAAVAKKKNLVTCPTCKGSGHVQGATKP